MKRWTDLLQTFRSEVAIYRSVMADPRCPRLSRWLLRLAVVYALSPVDLIPDFIPILGHLDDLLLVPLLVWLALRAIPKDLILEHRSRMAKARDQEIAAAPLPPEA